VEFPNTNIVHNVPGLPNSSMNHWGGQSIWTHLYWPQPAHSHRQHSPTRPQLKGSSCIRYPEPQLKGSHSGPQPIECHVLNPHPRPQPKDTFRATIQGTPASPPLRYLRSLIDHALQFPSHMFNTTIIHALNAQQYPRSLMLKAFVIPVQPISLKLDPLAWESLQNLCNLRSLA